MATEFRREATAETAPVGEPASLLARLESINRLTATTARAQTAEEIYAAALDAVEQALGVTRASILLFDPDGVMRFKAWRCLSDAYRRATEGHTPWAPHSPDAQPVLVGDVAADEALTALRPVLAAEGIRAVGFFPLLQPGRVLGKFMAYYDTPHHFTNVDVTLARVIAGHVAFAVERRRTEEALREREGQQEAQRRTAEALAHAASLLSRSLEPDVVAQQIVDHVRSLLACGAAVFARLDPESGALVVRAVSGAVGSFWRPGLRVPAEVGQMWCAIRARRAVRTANILEEPGIHWTPEVRAAVAAAPYRAALALPLVIENRVIGALAAGDRVGREFTEAEAELASAFGTQAAVAAENARLYQAVEAASRAKDEFLAILGHELRNPLGAIANAVHVLDVTDRSNETRAHIRGILVRQTSKLRRLVDDLLDVSRLMTGKMVLQRQPLDVREVVAVSLASLHQAGQGTAHDIVVDADPIWIDGDPTRIEQIVSNLVENAVKYTPERGRIRIEVRTEDGMARLRVADTGIGIGAPMLPRVFDLFSQERQAIDRAPGGLGLGLTLVKRLVELHGGTVTAQSDGPGRGSEFVVRLPALARVPHPPAGPPATPSAPPRRVLVIEDHRDSREALRVLLELDGHRVVEAADAEAGLARLVETRPDIAFVDIGLPGRDGYAVAQAIRATPAGRDVLLVALTGYGQPEDQARVLQAGFDCHLVKPVTAATLADVLSSAGRRR